MKNQLLELMLDGNYYTRYVSAIKKLRRRRMLGSGSSKKAVVQYASSIKAYRLYPPWYSRARNFEVLGVSIVTGYPLPS